MFFLKDINNSSFVNVRKKKIEKRIVAVQAAKEKLLSKFKTFEEYREIFTKCSSNLNLRIKFMNYVPWVQNLRIFEIFFLSLWSWVWRASVCVGK